MKPLKPRDKITQKMTRDGLTLDNQTTGESVNVSDREAEQDYTGPEPGGASEKVLERAGDIRDRRKAKRVAKDGGEMAAQATGPASRLQFTAEERASPELAPYIQKAEKRADSLDAAREALPKKRVVTKETLYDEASGRAKSRLHFEKVEKDPPKLKSSPASRPVQEAALFLHGKIHEVERENVGVEGGHKGEELAERQAGRAIRSGIRRHKLKPYRAAAKAERKSIVANAEYIYQKIPTGQPGTGAGGEKPRVPVLAETAYQTGVRQGSAGGGPDGAGGGQSDTGQRSRSQESRRGKQTGRLFRGTALERGVAGGRRCPDAPDGDGRPAILHRHVRQRRNRHCGDLLSLRRQRYAGGRGRLFRYGGGLAA